MPFRVVEIVDGNRTEISVLTPEPISCPLEQWFQWPTEKIDAQIFIFDLQVLQNNARPQYI